MVFARIVSQTGIGNQRQPSARRPLLSDLTDHIIRTYSERIRNSVRRVWRGSMFTKFCFAVLLLGGTAMAAEIPSTPTTFNKNVLPILQKNCQGCHRPAQIAPMSLLRYTEAPPWAKAMK